jgi:hypothetical protein
LNFYAKELLEAISSGESPRGALVLDLTIKQKSRYHDFFFMIKTVFAPTAKHCCQTVFHVS